MACCRHIRFVIFFFNGSKSIRPRLQLQCHQTITLGSEASSSLLGDESGRTAQKALGGWAADPSPRRRRSIWKGLTFQLTAWLLPVGSTEWPRGGGGGLDSAGQVSLRFLLRPANEPAARQRERKKHRTEVPRPKPSVVKKVASLCGKNPGEAEARLNSEHVKSRPRRSESYGRARSPIGPPNREPLPIRRHFPTGP